MLSHKKKIEVLSHKKKIGGFCNFVLNFIILWLFVIFFGFNFFMGSYLLVEYVAGLNLFILLLFFYILNFFSSCGCP